MVRRAVACAIVDTVTPRLPRGRSVDLPRRGRTWLLDTATPGPPVMLLHGWTSTAALNWFCCFEALSTEHRVLALDHRGHGQGIRSRRPFRLEDCANDVAALVDHLGVGPVTAVGYSMGGPIAQLLWRRYPEVVSSLVLCATAARFGDRSRLRGPWGVVGAGMAAALAAIPAPIRRGGLTWLLRRRTAGATLDGWAAVEQSRSDPAALVQAGLALARYDATGWIGEVDVPASVIVTARDLTVPPARQLEMAAAIPGAKVLTVDGDHRACVDAPGEFAPALLAACSV